MELQQIMVNILIGVSIIFLICIGIYLTRLLIELRKLAQTAIKATETLQSEVEPTLKELRQASDSINSIVSGVNNKFSTLDTALKTAANATSTVGRKIGGLLGGFLSGITTGIKLFRKK